MSTDDILPQFKPGKRADESCAHRTPRPMNKFPEIWWSPSLAADAPCGGRVDPYAGMLWAHVSSQGYVTPPSLPADAVRVLVEREHAPADWPARFLAAAAAADDDLFDGDAFRIVANHLGHWPAGVVEAIGRALLGDDGGQD